jgi:NTP pyrophosphatase (non-canonical NTP hydrolase)
MSDRRSRARYYYAMNEIEELMQKVVAFRDERDWKQFHNPKDCAISLSLEAAEVLEHFQWKNEVEASLYVQEKKDAIAEELADVFNVVLLMCHDLDINLSKALTNKIKKNAEKYPIEKSKGKHTKYTML